MFIFEDRIYVVNTFLRYQMSHVYNNLYFHQLYIFPILDSIHNFDKNNLFCGTILLSTFLILDPSPWTFLLRFI